MQTTLLTGLDSGNNSCQWNLIGISCHQDIRSCMLCIIWLPVVKVFYCADSACICLCSVPKKTELSNFWYKKAFHGQQYWQLRTDTVQLRQKPRMLIKQIMFKQKPTNKDQRKGAREVWWLSIALLNSLLSWRRGKIKQLSWKLQRVNMTRHIIFVTGCLLQWLYQSCNTPKKQNKNNINQISEMKYDEHAVGERLVTYYLDFNATVKDD